MVKFLIVIEKARGNYSAYSPDLPGCVATGKTRQSTVKNMHEAISIHLKGLKEDGIPIPKPQSSASFVAVEAGLVGRAPSMGGIR